jgi:hypothetical protein
MQLGPIVLKLRLATTQFENRIAGAAELAYALKGALQAEMAFVVQLAETASKNTLDSDINQLITERFGVIVMLENDTAQTDKTGLTAYDSLSTIRAELFTALLGWQVPGTEDLVSYGGGRVLGINRAQFWYQFEFITTTRIGNDDGVDVGRSDLEDFDSIYAQWVLAPDAELPISEDLPVATFNPDMTTLVDLTVDPDSGAFGSGFGIKFDVDES